MRFAWLALLASCALEPRAEPQETPLEKLRAKTNAYTSFHYKAELTDGEMVVPIEMACRAPDRALLRYGPNHAVLVIDGVSHHFERKNYASIPVGAMLDDLRRTYGDLLPSRPEPAFLLGRWERPLSRLGLLATIDVRPLGSRLGWLDELASWLVEGNLYHTGAIEVELRDDGFIQRAKVASSAELTLKELTINGPLDDALFALPPLEGTTDISDARRPQRARELEEAFHRWVLAGKPGDAALDALTKVDLLNSYEPAKSAEFQKKNLDDEIEAYRKQQPDAKPLALHEKIEIARGKAMGALEFMAEEIQKEFRHRLNLALGAREAPPSIAERWAAAVSRQIDLQIRRPLDQVFSDKLKQ